MLVLGLYKCQTPNENDIKEFLTSNRHYVYSLGNFGFTEEFVIIFPTNDTEVTYLQLKYQNLFAIINVDKDYVPLPNFSVHLEDSVTHYTMISRNISEWFF